MDAPHELPHWAKPGVDAGHSRAPASPAADASQQTPTAGPGHRQLAPAPRRGWLLAPEQLAAQQGQQPGALLQGGAAANAEQFQRQTAGWEATQALLQRVLREQGPFDGVLGLSQGAAVAAVLAAQQGSGSAAPPPRGVRFAILCSGYRSPVPEHLRLLDAASAAGGVALPSLHIYGAARGPSGQGDRQVSPDESAALAACFCPAQVRSPFGGGGFSCWLLDPAEGCLVGPALAAALLSCETTKTRAACWPLPPCLQRTVVRHAGGHLIPTSPEVVAALRAFLLQHGAQQGS